METKSTDTGANELSTVSFKTEIDVDDEPGVNKYNITLYPSSDWASEFDTNQYNSCPRNTVDDGELLPESIVETQMDEDVKPTPDLLLNHYNRTKHLLCGPANKQRKRKKKRIDARERKYYCDICQYGTVYRHGIKSHLLKHAKNKSYECDQCQYKTKFPTALYRHKQIHDRTKAYSCPFCDYVGHYNSYMKTHIIRKHTPQGPLQCAFCEFNTVYKYEYQVHMKSHAVTNTSHPQNTTNTNKKQTQEINKSPNDEQKRETKKMCTLIKNDRLGKMYKCNCCQYTSYSAARVKNHAVMHDDRKPFKCKVCNFTSKHGTALRRHERYQHTELYINEIPLSCNQCQYTTYDPVRMKYHNIHTHPAMSYNCKACKYRTDDEMEYLKHIISRHNMIQLKRTKVAFSKKKFNTRKETENDNQKDPLDLQALSKTKPKIKRKKWLHRITYKCNHCYYKTIDKMKIIRHSTQTPHEGYNYLCDCEFATKDPTLYNVHLETTCVRKKYTCVACNLVAANKQELDDHFKCHIQNVKPDSQAKMMEDENIKHKDEIVKDEQMETNCIVEARDFDVTGGIPVENGHEELRLYKCMLCDFASPIRQDLSNHLKEHLPPYNCRLCDHTTKYLSSLRRHVTMHLEDSFQFKCELCDFTTSQSLYLKLHMRKHSMKKQYKCDSCPFETAYRNCIIKHVRVHTKTCFQKNIETCGEQLLERRTYNCDCCAFQAFSEGRVIKHRYKIHGIPLPSEFSNKCDYCDFCTKDKWKLKIHYQRSFRGSLIKCKLCDFETEYKCLLRFHLSQHPDHFVPNSRSNVPSGLSCSSRHTGLTAPSESPTAAESAAIIYHFIDNHQVDYLEWNDIPVNENPADEKRFKCPHCLFASKYKHGVRRHFQRHHIRNNKQYHCLNCPFVTSTEISLDRHNRGSKSADPLNCSRCNQFTSFYKCELALHAKTHDKFTCSTCDYSCNSKYILARHVMKCHKEVHNQ